MKLVQPKIIVDGDNKNQDMAKHGAVKGLSYLHVVWAFGFLPETEYAVTYGVSVPERTYVLSNFGGEIDETFVGDEADLPRKFKKVINFKFLFARDLDSRMSDGV
jgi:hypothetical protein